jgi:DNA-binding phage protein
MALTRNFLDTIAADLKGNREFRLAYLGETIESFHDGDLATGKGMLRNYINATVGFGALSKATEIPVKSLMRMLSASGNPQADKLFAILSHVEGLERVRVKLEALPARGRRRTERPHARL